MNKEVAHTIYDSIKKNRNGTCK